MFIYYFFKRLIVGGGRRLEGREEIWVINKSCYFVLILNVIIV